MQATLSGLINDVYTLTNRPDLESETLLAVRAATLKAHRTDFFDKDLFETGIQFDYSKTQQSLEYRQLIPRWRTAKYLRKYAGDPITGTPGSFFEILTPDSVLDSYGINKENVAYIAGVELKIRSREAIQYLLLGCYVNPDVTIDRYNSWIALEFPMTIVYEAASTVFKTIGYDEQVATYNKLVAEEYEQLQASNIATIGY